VSPQLLWSKGDIALLIAIAGTTISPYLFFWQSAEEVEERNVTAHYRVSRAHIQAMRGDVLAGMATGVFAMTAIMITAAATLHKNGVTNIQTAEQAAQALAPIAGDFAGTLFLIGIVGTGLLSIPVLAGASSYAVAETFGWRESLEKRPSQAKAFYAVIMLSILVGLTLNLVGLNPMQFLLVAAITNGLAAPILMAVIWWIASDEKLLGKWVSPLWSRLLLGIATISMAALPVLWLLAP
jgi:Mn2+/Fe2+ NRAMP family transporter